MSFGLKDSSSGSLCRLPSPGCLDHSFLYLPWYEHRKRKKKEPARLAACFCTCSFPIDSKPGNISDPHLHASFSVRKRRPHFSIWHFSVCPLSLFAPWTEEFSGLPFTSFCISFCRSNSPVPTISLPGQGQGVTRSGC